MPFLKTIILLFIIVNSVFLAQKKTNLEIVDSLLGLSVSQISNTFQNKEQNYKFQFNSPEDYTALSNSILEKLQKNGFKFSTEVEQSEILNYSIKNISVGYPEMFRDGIFGNYLVNRKIYLEGSFYLSANGKLGEVENFVYDVSDTLALDDINSVQNIAYGFTSPEIPNEPFFSSIIEPAIAVGTAAVAVYLFFNVRSK
jgi:hypothetical protein